MKGDNKRFFAPDMTLAEIRRRFPRGELLNDMVSNFSVDIVGHGGYLVCPRFDLKREQPLCMGYASTSNIGFIVQRVATLLGLFEDDGRDFGKAIANCPLRIYDWGGGGDIRMKTVCIGHFMENRFIYGWDLMLTGLPLERAAELKEGGAE